MNDHNSTNLAEWLVDTLRGMAVILMISPLLLYRFIHGDSGRYIWLISGPAPFNHLGSGPYQMLIYGGLLMSGITLYLLTSFIKKRQRT